MHAIDLETAFKVRDHLHTPGSAVLPCGACRHLL